MNNKEKIADAKEDMTELSMTEFTNMVNSEPSPQLSNSLKSNNIIVINNVVFR